MVNRPSPPLLFSAPIAGGSQLWGCSRVQGGWKFLHPPPSPQCQVVRDTGRRLPSRGKRGQAKTSREEPSSQRTRTCEAWGSQLCRQGHWQSLEGLCRVLFASVDCLGVGGLCPSRAVSGEEGELDIGSPLRRGPCSTSSTGPVLGGSSEVSRSCRSSWSLTSEARRESPRCGGAVFPRTVMPALTAKLQTWEGIPP